MCMLYENISFAFGRYKDGERSFCSNRDETYINKPDFRQPVWGVGGGGNRCCSKNGRGKLR